MTTVNLGLRDKNTGKVYYRTVEFMREFWRKNPDREIADWIVERGNPQHSTVKQPANLELISYIIQKP